MDKSTQEQHQRTILIIGGSYAGLSCAHYFLQHVLPELDDGHLYAVTLVNPSAKFMARTASPRAAVSAKRMPPQKIFWDIAAGFSHYPTGQFRFVQAQAVSMSLHGRTVTFDTPTGDKLCIPYYALIISTGSSPQTPLLGVLSTQEQVQQAHAAFQKAIGQAKCVVVAGGGPAAVEIAAEIAQECNGSASWFGTVEPRVEVAMLVRGSRLLSGLPLSVAQAADAQLQSLGVTILYNETVTSISGKEEKSTSHGIGEVTTRKIIKTKNRNTFEADLFIPATGVTPNTNFVPRHLLSDRGYIKVHPSTLRVGEAGPRVYSIGDCADYNRRDLLDLYAAIPVIISNLKQDILQESSGKAAEDVHYLQDPKHTQLIPIGDGMGVGLISDWFAPSWLVRWIKGRDYLIGKTPGIVNGEKWKRTKSKLNYVLP